MDTFSGYLAKKQNRTNVSQIYYIQWTYSSVAQNKNKFPILIICKYVPFSTAALLKNCGHSCVKKIRKINFKSLQLVLLSQL